MILRKVGEVNIFKHILYISALEQARVLILGQYVFQGVHAVFYLRKKVAGSTLKIEGCIFGALPRIGPRGGEPERGVPPSWWGGCGATPKKILKIG